MSLETLAELVVIASLTVLLVALVARPPRIDQLRRQRWYDTSLRFGLGFGFLGLVALLIVLKFGDHLVVAIALAAELAGVTLLAVEVWTGQEADRFAAAMESLLRVDELGDDDWLFITHAGPVIARELERVEIVLREAERDVHTKRTAGAAWNGPLENAKARKLSLDAIKTSASMFSQIGRGASPADLRSAAREVRGRLNTTFIEAHDWHQRRRGRVFAARRLRLAAGVALIALAAVLHAWDLPAIVGS